MYIASLARWDTIERFGGAGKALSGPDAGSEIFEREALSGLVEDKIRSQSKVTERYYETIFEELRELQEKAREALFLVQKKHILTRYQSERNKERMLQRLGGSRAMRNGLTLKTRFLLSRARPQWLVAWKK